MASKTIIIKGINADHSLQLSDSGHTRTVKKAVITWKIKRRSGVTAITCIEPKDGSVSIFKPGDPKPVQGTTRWQGKIKDLTLPATEEYSIGYIDASGKPYLYDPKISVNTSFFNIIAFKKKLVLFVLALLALFSILSLFRHKNKG